MLSVLKQDRQNEKIFFKERCPAADIGPPGANVLYYAVDIPHRGHHGYGPTHWDSWMFSLLDESGGVHLRPPIYQKTFPWSNVKGCSLCFPF
jgi:hypothetical protein